MKNILALIIALCWLISPAVEVHAQATCATRTLQSYGNPAGMLDTAQLAGFNAPQCYVPSNGATDSYAWNIADSGDVVIIMVPMQAGNYNVQVWRDCRYILFDTAMYMQPDTGWNPSQVRLWVPEGSQLVISGQSADVIAVLYWHQPWSWFTHHQPLVDTDTLCQITAITEPAIVGDGIYREIWPPYRETFEPPPGVLYMRNRKLVTVR